MTQEITPEQIAEQEKMKVDMKAFNDGLGALIEKTGITVIAQISYGADGIRPVLKLGRFTPMEQPVSAKAPKAPKTPVAPKKKNGKK